jgi:hypothetical protein
MAVAIGIERCRWGQFKRRTGGSNLSRRYGGDVKLSKAAVPRTPGVAVLRRSLGLAFG